MHVIFFGTGSFAVAILERLASSSYRPILCVTQPDRPQGRGLIRGASPVKESAGRFGIPLVQPRRPDEELVRTAKADIGVVVDFGQIIGSALLKAVPYGMIGVHPSLLPAYRGSAPIAWALLKGDAKIGVTIFRLNDRLDAGEVLRQKTVPIDPGECADALSERLARLGAEELLQALDGITAGVIQGRPQDEAQASLAPKLTKEQGQILWSKSAEEIVRQIRALKPWPGSSTHWQGKLLKIWRASVENRSEARKEAPGTVIALEPEGLLVAAGTEVVRITELQLAGSRRMSVRDFLAGHQLKVGDRFDP
ncbi:MAG: methionyl-tRNA formyltransferase [Candidatus Omnitrophica bacterium]|nr:methionyl-tRNA formyltransferase [Candidatus Omnitrophota bacterium]